MKSVEDMVKRTAENFIPAHYTEGMCFVDHAENEADMEEYAPCRSCKDIILEYIAENGKYDIGDMDGTEGFVSFAFLTSNDDVDGADKFTGDFEGVRIYDAFGGPTCYLDTREGIYVGSWWLHGATAQIDAYAIAEINEYWNDYYECIKVETD